MRDKIARLLYNRKRSHTAGYGKGLKSHRFYGARSVFRYYCHFDWSFSFSNRGANRFFFFFFLGNKREELSRYFFFFFFFYSLSPFLSRHASRQGFESIATWEYHAWYNKSLHKNRAILFFVFFNSKYLLKAQHS